jgi:ABC-type transporter Mla subunit MlaD
VRLPSVPGPADVLAAVGGVRDGVAEAIDLIPRMGSLLGRAESMVDRMSALLARVEEIVDRADAEITAVHATRRKADEAIEAVGATQQKADDAITAVGRTTSRADGTLDEAEGLVGRLAPLVGDYEPLLTALAPSLRRLATTLEPHEVEAMVTLIDRLPTLVTHLDQDILPVLESLGNVGTDVNDLVDIVQDMRQVVKGFPGSRLFRRRGAEEIAQDEAEEATRS